MLIDKKFFEDSESWPFAESREILKKRLKIIEKKGWQNEKCSRDC